MNDYILEVCVDSAESALAAAKGGQAGWSCVRIW